jgi:SAM-dependent methyltransferase
MIYPFVSLIRINRRSYRSTRSIDNFIRPYQTVELANGASLDLGCGNNPRNPFCAKFFYGVDIRGDVASPYIRQADLSHDKIPFESNTFNIVTAFDFLEHIPRISYKDGEPRYAFIKLLNEVHRVLKPSGYFLYSMPVYPSPEAYQDPTHVNIMTEHTIPYYFCEPRSWASMLGYGFTGKFRLLKQAWIYNHSIIGLIQAL